MKYTIPKPQSVLQEEQKQDQELASQIVALVLEHEEAAWGPVTEILKKFRKQVKNS